MAKRGKGGRPKSQARDEVVKDADGKPLFRVRRQNSTIAILLPIENVSARSLAAINRLSILQDARRQTIDIRSQPFSDSPAAPS